MPKQVRRGREFWVQLVEEFEQGGSAEGHQEFAERQKVRCDSFRRWLYRLRAERNGRRWRSSRGARTRKTGGSVGWPLVEVQGVAVGDSRFEIELAGGRRLLVPASFDEEALRRLLAVLSEKVA
jgi:hypothetical protein